MNHEDVCREAGVDPCSCNSDMRSVIKYMAENDVTLDDTPQKIKDQVHAWNWNHTIFDIYDEIKSRSDSEIAELLTFALQVFKDNVYTCHQIQDLAMHLGVDHLVTEKQERAT